MNTLIRKIYEDNANRKLTDKRFALLSGEYEKEQSDLEISVTQLRAELESFHTDSIRIEAKRKTTRGKNSITHPLKCGLQ